MRGRFRRDLFCRSGLLAFLRLMYPEERPAENFPPRAAGSVVRIADPEQRHQSEQEGESRSSEPSRREQEGRAKYRSEFAPHRSH